MIKRIKNITAILIICALLLALLPGCSGGINRKRILEDLAANNSIVVSIASNAPSNYISLNGLELTGVKIKKRSTKDGVMTITTTVTAENTYISCRAGCTVKYIEHDELGWVINSAELDDAQGWYYTPLSAISSSSVSVSDLPYSSNISYDNFSVKGVSFNNKSLTSTADVNLSANNMYVICEGDVSISYSFMGDRWQRTGFTRGDNFSISWDIGGEWQSEIYKWNSDSDWELQYVFVIHSIDVNANVNATVHDYIFEDGKEIQDKSYDVLGKIDPDTMTLTLDFGDGKQINATLGNDGFSGSIINTTDSFTYYNGAFTRV